MVCWLVVFAVLGQAVAKRGHVLEQPLLLQVAQVARRRPDGVLALVADVAAVGLDHVVEELGEEGPRDLVRIEREVLVGPALAVREVAQVLDPLDQRREERPSRGRGVFGVAADAQRLVLGVQRLVVGTQRLVLGPQHLRLRSGHGDSCRLGRRQRCDAGGQDDEEHPV
jgi:hypothetical protein